MVRSAYELTLHGQSRRGQQVDDAIRRQPIRHEIDVVAIGVRQVPWLVACLEREQQVPAANDRSARNGA